MAGACECDNELSGSIKRVEFLDWLRTCQFLREDSDTWSLLVTNYSSVREFNSFTLAPLNMPQVIK